jgi:hypothetical protein
MVFSHSPEASAQSFEAMLFHVVYLGTTLTDQNCLHEEIKSRLSLGNAYYHSVQSRFSSRLLSRNAEVKIYRTIILQLFCVVVKLGHSHQGKSIGWGSLRAEF